jgi:RNA polymerase sigma-70 factor (ECF subfamily)
MGDHASRGIRATGADRTKPQTALKWMGFRTIPGNREESWYSSDTDGWSVFPMKTFEAVYREHVQAVFRFALSVAGSKDRAEDLTSEAFLALLRNFADIDQSQLPAWLITVVRNRARDQWRRRVVEERHAMEVGARKPEAATPTLENWILEDPRLKPVHRTCLMLRYVHEMTRTEIASRLGLTETQVKGHLQYALTLLRKSFQTPVEP